MSQLGDRDPVLVLGLASVSSTATLDPEPDPDPDPAETSASYSSALGCLGPPAALASSPFGVTLEKKMACVILPQVHILCSLFCRDFCLVLVDLHGFFVLSRY